MVGDDPNQYLFYTNTFADHSQYDPLFGRWANKQVLTRFFRDFLLAQKPDIVHIQHTIFLGYDLLRVIRNTLPDVPIVYTLHEYLPICHRDGQMVRTRTEDLCQEESPRRCHECFPHISPQTFFMRKRFIQSHLRSSTGSSRRPTTCATATSTGASPPTGSSVEPQGMMPVDGPASPTRASRTRAQPLRLLRAVQSVQGRGRAARGDGAPRRRLRRAPWIHGANLEIQPVEFRERVAALSDGSREQRHVRRAVRARSSSAS